MKKRILSVFIAMTMVVAMIPAVSLESWAAGSGDGWTLEDGVLTVSSDSAMESAKWRAGGIYEDIETETVNWDIGIDDVLEILKYMVKIQCDIDIMGYRE